MLPRPKAIRCAPSIGAACAKRHRAYLFEIVFGGGEAACNPLHFMGRELSKHAFRLCAPEEIEELKARVVQELPDLQPLLTTVGRPPDFGQNSIPSILVRKNLRHESRKVTLEAMKVVTRVQCHALQQNSNFRKEAGEDLVPVSIMERGGVGQTAPPYFSRVTYMCRSQLLQQKHVLMSPIRVDFCSVLSNTRIAPGERNGGRFALMTAP